MILLKTYAVRRWEHPAGAQTNDWQTATQAWFICLINISHVFWAECVTSAPDKRVQEPL